LIFREVRRKQKLKLRQLQEEERLLSEKAVADAEETERRRIAADLHDNLGAQLSFIKRNVDFIMDQPAGLSLADERKYLSSVNDIAQSAMIDLRETIWVLNKDEVSVQEFADKLKSYLKQQLMGKETIQWQFKEDISDNWKLSSGEVMHLFRIVQEVISNIIKHAEAGRINIKFNSGAPGCYHLEIYDDGKGFDVGSKYDGHYGLENIEQRAVEISAVLSITSDADNGTHIILYKGKK
jgi:signal transduction histidine kinase